MKYLLLLYDAPNIRERISAGQIQQITELIEEIKGTGELVTTDALADPSLTTTISPAPNAAGATPAVTDGPYAEIKEQMGGFVLIDAESKQRALDIAARWPLDVVNAIEVRPLMYQGAEPE